MQPVPTPWEDYKPVTPLPYVQNNDPPMNPHPESHLHPECFRQECGCPCNWGSDYPMECEGSVNCPFCNRQCRGCKRCGYVDPCDCSTARNLRTGPPSMMNQNPQPHPIYQNNVQPGMQGQFNNPMQFRNMVPASAQTQPQHFMQQSQNPMSDGMFCGQCVHDINPNSVFSPTMNNPQQSNGMMNSNFPPMQSQSQCCFQPANGQMTRCNRPACTSCYPSNFNQQQVIQPLFNQPMQMQQGPSFNNNTMQSPMMHCHMQPSYDF